MNDVTTEYLGLLDQANSDQQTYISNRRSFDLFDEFLVRKGLNAKEVKLLDLREWLRSELQKYKPSTVAKHAIAVRAAYTYAHEIGMTDRNLAAGFDKMIPRVVDSIPETFTAEELRAMHGALDSEREEIVFHLLLWTGARATEVRTLRWGSIDFENQQIVVVGKNKKIRYVPLHPILERKLVAWNAQCDEGCHAVVPTQRGEMMSNWTWNQEVAGFMQRAGVHKKKRSHVFRRSLNTNLGRQQVPEQVLDAIFGWAPATVRTKHYTGLASDETRHAILKAYADDPVVPEQATLTSEYDGMIEKLQGEIERLKALKATPRTAADLLALDL